MPRRLLLLLLILLIGGYFFLGRGSPTKESLPALSLSATVNPSEKGYVVGADGYLYLPEEKEYNVVGSVYLSVNGVKVKEQRIETVSKGPSRLPLSLAGVPVSSSNAAVGASLTITVDRREMNLSVESPVTFPPKSSLLLLPSVSVYPLSVDRTSTGYDVTLKVVLYNPNDFEISVKDPKLTVGGETFSLPISTISARDYSSTEITFSTEENSAEGRVTGSAEWSGVKKDFSYSFSLSFPEIAPPQPLYALDASFLSASNEGLKVKVTVSVKNPSGLPVSVPGLKVAVRKGDTVKEVNVSDSFTLGPLEEKNFSKEISAIPFFNGGVIELVAGDAVVSSAPLEIAPQTILPTPEVNLWMEDVNTGAYILHVFLKSSAEYNIDVEDFDVEGEYEGADVIDFDAISFSFKGEKEVTVGSDTNPLALPPGTKITISFRYGLKGLNLWQTYRLTVT